MKTASMLFGLVVATSGIANANPLLKITRSAAQPRVDANGDVACGNVMSKSPDDTCTLRTATRTPAASPTPTRTPAPVQVIPAARPHVDEDGDIVCGNVMRKGGSKHVCHARTAADGRASKQHDPILAAFYGTTI